MTIKAAPIVHKAAKEDNIDLSQIKGSGTNGTITKADYEEFTGKEITATYQRENDDRTSMNKLTESNQLSIGGMKFSKRGVFDHSSTKTLDIPEELKNNNLIYRWVNDVNGRVDSANQKGYEIVDSSHLGKDISTRRRVGTGKDGSDVHTVLMATPKQWYQERQSAAEKNRRTKEDGMFDTPQDESGNLGSEFYRKEQ